MDKLLITHPLFFCNASWLRPRYQLPFQYIVRYSIRADDPCYGHDWAVRVLAQIPNLGSRNSILSYKRKGIHNYRADNVCTVIEKQYHCYFCFSLCIAYLVPSPLALNGFPPNSFVVGQSCRIIFEWNSRSRSSSSCNPRKIPNPIVQFYTSS